VREVVPNGWRWRWEEAQAAALGAIAGLRDSGPGGHAAGGGAATGHHHPRGATVRRRGDEPGTNSELLPVQ